MVEINVLKKVLSDQRDWIKPESDWVLRDKLKDIKEYLNIPHIVVITGPRRSGKSVFLSQIMNEYYKKENFYYISFEDERLVSLKTEDMQVVMENLSLLFGESKIIFIDEIQNIKGWERFVARLYKEKYKIFLTGSNTNLLSSELSTYLTGRNITVDLMPFSFKEFIKFKNVHFDNNSFYKSDIQIELKKYIEEFLFKGSFPEVVKFGKTNILYNYFSDIVDKDVIKRYSIKEKATLKEIAHFLIANGTMDVSYNKLKNVYNLGSPHTAKNYVEYLESAFLVYLIKKHSFSTKEQHIRSRKVYPVDTGLFALMRASEASDIGKMYEISVFHKLKQMSKDIYFYKDEQNREVDFVIKDKNKIEYLIQVSYDIADEKTYRREINALFSAMKKFGLEESIIITQEAKEPIKKNDKKIRIISLLEFLLDRY